LAEANWYWAQGDQQNGPVAGSAIARLVADGKLGADDLIWKEGMANWIPISKVSALSKYLKTPAAQPVGVAPVVKPVIKKTAALAADLQAVTPIAYQSAPADSRGVYQYVNDPSETVACPHCTVANAGDAQWCESCGMALPIPSAGPRIVDGTSFAATTAGQHLQSDELDKQAKKAATALMWVAIIQTVLGVIWIVATASNPNMAPITQQPIALGLLIVAAIFWGLFVWARKQPVPAAIVGLVLYSTLKVINLVLAISQGTIGKQQTVPNGIANTGIGWIDIVIIVVLCQAISAGLKYRKMQSNAGEIAS
jgi:hypothetical protein